MLWRYNIPGCEAGPVGTCVLSWKLRFQESRLWGDFPWLFSKSNFFFFFKCQCFQMFLKCACPERWPIIDEFSDSCITLLFFPSFLSFFFFLYFSLLSSFLPLSFFLCLSVCLFRATPAADGSSQARGQIGAIADSLCHSHSKKGQDPSHVYNLDHSSRQCRIINPLNEAWILVGFISTEPRWELLIPALLFYSTANLSQFWMSWF